MSTPLALKIGPLPEVLGSGKFTPLARMHLERPNGEAKPVAVVAPTEPEPEPPPADTAPTQTSV